MSKWGVKINGAKCKFISASDQRFVIDGKEVEHVEEFQGNLVPNSAKDAVKAYRTRVDGIWQTERGHLEKESISNALKLSIYNALIGFIVTYASETWTLRSS